MGSPLIFEFQINNTYIFSYKCSPNIAWDACTLKKLFAICLKSKSITWPYIFICWRPCIAAQSFWFFFFSLLNLASIHGVFDWWSRHSGFGYHALSWPTFSEQVTFFFFTPLGMLLKQWLCYENNSHPKVFELRIYSLERTCHWGFRNHCLTLCFPTFDAF